MIESYLHQFGLAFMAFFAIMNPVSSLPVYLSLTDGDDRRTARAVARKGLMIAFAIVVVFAFAGRYIFELFGITLPALRIAGGILVFLIGFHMVQGNRSPMHRQPSAAAVEDPAAHAMRYEEKMNVAISPLGTPLLAGPGTIATAMNLAAGDTLAGTAVVVAAFLLLCAITYTLFIFGPKITRLMGKNVMNVVTRMMGLILAVIGTQMLVAGLKGAFPLLN
ncbi:multiple antibiotic resistance protein [Kingella potus DSM 18304]